MSANSLMKTFVDASRVSATSPLPTSRPAASTLPQDRERLFNLAAEIGHVTTRGRSACAAAGQRQFTLTNRVDISVRFVR
jgi:hypothetical protein